MDNIPLIIGYTLDRALQIIGEKQSIIIDSTSTPFEDKKKERRGNSPIVVRQKAESGKIILTTSCFK